MWRSNKDKTEKRLLPPSSQTLQHARADREAKRGSYFTEMARNWAPVVRKPVVEEEVVAAIPNDPNLPAWLRHRPVGNGGPKLFFRTKAVVRNPKRPK